MADFLLVSVERVKQALRIDTTDDDAILEVWISAASRAVVRYLKGEAGDFLSIDSPPNSPPDDLEAVPQEVVAAVIILTGMLYKEPDGDEMKDFANYGTLPWKVTALIYPLRVPTMA